jgi:hypothetical protein
MRTAVLAGVAAVALLAAGAAQAADLALKRVLLSTGGVGLYEYEADVEGDATVELTAPLDQIDDILKSLVVFDDHGGVGGLDLPGPRPLEDSFRTLPFTLADLASTPQLLTALRGAEVEVGGPRALKGRIVAVAEENEAKAGGETLTTRHRISVMTDSGLQSFVLEQADGVRFVDPALNDSIGRALKAVAEDAQKNSRALRLSSRGEGKRKLHVAYLAAAPVWKVAYRLVLDPAPDAKTATLQGWATLENFSGQDWRDVDLTLVSGRPVAYRQALYRAYNITRPEAPLDIGAQLNPDEDGGALPAPSAPAPLPAPRMAKSRSFALAGAAEPQDAVRPLALAPGAEAVAAQEGETQVAFHLPHAVSVAEGRTLSLPIVDGETPAARLAIFDPQVDAHHPLGAAELTNAGAAALPPGVVTIYEKGAGGVTYVGDARLSATPAGEKRLLSYALDAKTTIEVDNSDVTSLARARVAKGVLTLDDLLRRRTVYRVKADAPRKLIVYAPKLPGGKLTAPDPKGVTEADGRYRVPFDVKAGDAQSFVVTQERTQTRAVALARLDDAALAVYVKSGDLDPATRAALETLAGLRAAQTQAERALDTAKRQVEAIEADQTRLKDLLGAVAAGSDLSKRYLSKLDADETELDKRRAEVAARESARDRARQAVENFVAGS